MDNMNADQELQEIELSMDQAKERIEMADALQRLLKNADFKKIILDGYIEKYAVALVKRKSMFTLLSDPKQQAYIDSQITGIGALDQYLHFVLQEGRVAERALEAHTQERDQILESQGV